jgi:hypothetical protein
VRAGFTETGWRRLVFAEPGPCFVTSAVMILEPDGRKIAVTHMPDTEAASQGRTRFILSAPPGGGHVRYADLLAEDGAAIIRVAIGAWVPDGGTLLVPIEVT